MPQNRFFPFPCCKFNQKAKQGKTKQTWKHIVDGGSMTEIGLWSNLRSWIWLIIWGVGFDYLSPSGTWRVSWSAVMSNQSISWLAYLALWSLVGPPFLSIAISSSFQHHLGWPRWSHHWHLTQNYSKTFLFNQQNKKKQNWMHIHGSIFSVSVVALVMLIKRLTCQRITLGLMLETQHHAKMHTLLFLSSLYFF